MENRNFQLDTEWNMIHYPTQQPNGFGILIIGDDRHFVDANNSFWVQNEGKKSIIDSLRNEGYTVFSSNLYGKNWGSERSIMLAKRLYEHMIRSEILNPKIHLIAEGMGALVAIKLMMEMKEKIRSVVLFNPILSLNEHLEEEKEHKFFFKKLCNEIASAYDKNAKFIPEFLKEMKEHQLEEAGTPSKIIHILHNGKSYYQSQLLKERTRKWDQEQLPIFVSYVLPEKRSAIPRQINRFFKQYEKNL
ncbi:hydrolase [Niallia circulans]|uniref:Hydrolase n=1 Tax=Niallia circulans TaxID=1397 RepID=A0A553SFM4_NIACI|nr:hydrolase [Niallia circulans]TRZ35790.1 hydrolase [Niallia circulans]